MTPSLEQDYRVMTILNTALHLPESERSSYLSVACKGHEELLQEIVEAIEWEERMGNFLRAPLISLQGLERPFQAGEVIAERFEIIREIGEGGMGVVYEAFDRKRQQRIAIKSAKLGFRRLLTPELESALKVRHANICLVNEIHSTPTEYGEVDFLTMELLDGQTLSARLSSSGALRHGEVLDVARQLCSALAEAHLSGVIHRDLKSANVILCRSDDGTRAVITDFGLATETTLNPRDLAGTPGYMAPELWRGDRPSTASDIYALGVILYEMVTGVKPFTDANTESRLTIPPVAPRTWTKELDSRWDAAILRCLDPSPAARPKDAKEVLALLERRPLPPFIAKLNEIWTPTNALIACLTAIAVIAIVYFWSTNRQRGFNLQNMKIAQITTAGNAGPAALSPDGRYIAYVLRDGAQESLWIEQLETRRKVQLLPAEQVNFIGVNFTPDGNYIMFVHSVKEGVGFRDLYEMPVLGGAPRQLIRDIDSAPAFSPDGRQFAFVRGIVNPVGNDIMIANADGSGGRVLARRLGFSPGANVAWSADGRTLAMVSPEVRENVTRWVLLGISAQTGEMREIHSFDSPAKAVAWLPDGHGVLVVGLNPDSGRGQIWSVSYPKGELSRFTNDLTDYDLCCLESTRDGKSLVVLENTTLSDLWVGKADGSDAQQITSGEALGLGLGWVGNRITAANSRLQWVLMNADGSNVTPLTNDQEPHPQLAACPDGQHVVYSTFHNSTFEVWRAEGDGSNPVKFLTGLLPGGSSCTADSKGVVYVSDNALWRIPLEGGTPVKLDVPSEYVWNIVYRRFLQEPGVFGFSWDGKLMFYFKAKEENGQPQISLVVTPSTGGEPLHSFVPPYGIQSMKFTPDGKAIAILLTRNRTSNIWEQPLTGGNPVPLTKFPSGEMFDFSWSRNGKLLAFSRGQRKTDVVMMSNFR